VCISYWVKLFFRNLSQTLSWIQVYLTYYSYGYKNRYSSSLSWLRKEDKRANLSESEHRRKMNNWSLVSGCFATTLILLVSLHSTKSLEHRPSSYSSSSTSSSSGTTSASNHLSVHQTLMDSALAASSNIASSNSPNISGSSSIERQQQHHEYMIANSTTNGRDEMASLNSDGEEIDYMTPEQEAYDMLGPIRDPMSTVIPMTIVYSVILVTGLVGNIVTCTVISRNKYMHTTVNYYLFSLSISDLLLLMLGCPQEIWMLWQKYPYVFGETFCVLRAMISEMCTNASVLTITAFTVERYIAICYPLKAHTMASLPRAIKTILCIWAISALCSVPISLQLGVIVQVSWTFLVNIILFRFNICLNTLFDTYHHCYVMHCRSCFSDVTHLQES